MSVRRDRSVRIALTPEAAAIARPALAETRLRGLSAAEEYRVIADRLYRQGVRDLPSGALIDWIEEEVASDYERFLSLRALGERVHAAIAAGDLSKAAWILACELDSDSRRRLIAGMRRLDDLDANRDDRSSTQPGPLARDN